MLKLNSKRFKLLSFLLIFILTIVSNVKAVSADSIDNFDIKLNVQENGLIKVRQKLKVNFTTQKHGIYATIPTSYSMNWNGVSKDYYFPVQNIKVLTHNYTVENEINGVLIKIGDENIYLEGENTFEYQYDIKTRDLKLDGIQMLYFNLVGNQWQLPIKKVNFEINMPKAFESKPNFYLDNNRNVNYEIKDKSIVGSYDYGLNAYEALTIKLDLNNNYFSYETNTNYQLLGLICLFILLILTIILFIKYGKDEKVIPTVEFKAPNGISSAQVGYIIDGYLSFKELTSLFVYWASKGYISIKELDSKSTFEFKKLKEIDNNEMNFEISLFNTIFKKKDTVKSDKLPKEFFDVALQANNDYKDFYQKDNSIFENKSTKIQYLLLLFTAILSGVFNALSTYSYYNLVIQSVIVFFVSFTIILIIGIITLKIISSIKIQQLFKKSIYFILIILGFLIYSILLVILSSIVEINIYLSLLSVVFLMIIIFFIAFMSKRTDKGHKLYEQILGLRDFINLVEKEKLEMFVEENPSFFYDILPYAYVLNVSDKWTKKFETIKMKAPTWYEGRDPNVSTYFMILAINNSMNSINTNISSSIMSSAAKGGSSGGNIGGGFSGGGFGGGGGGTW